MNCRMHNPACLQRRGPRLIAAVTNDRRGVAAIEFALFVGGLTLLLLNGVDAARYYFLRMELENATQMASQAAWKTCDPTHVPATANCPGLGAAITASLQSTSLGSQVAQQQGSPTENYKCVNSSGSLQNVGTLASPPTDCSSVGAPSNLPGDYITIATSYSFKPVFPGVGIGSMLPRNLTSTSTMRLK